MSFKNLSRDELYRSAIEDFAVEVEEDAAKSVILAALEETGISWSDYLAQHPEAGDSRDTEPDRGNVVKSENVAPQLAATEPARVRVAEPVVNASANDQWLVKMTRDNTLFEIAGHRFTQEHPYALVNSADAEVILREDGFRQALPSELEEFYS